MTKVIAYIKNIPNFIQISVAATKWKSNKYIHKLSDIQYSFCCQKNYYFFLTGLLHLLESQNKLIYYIASDPPRSP